MIFFFISLLMLIFKWYRFIFILISLEFLMMSVFVKFFEIFSGMMFFFFMCHSVISSILGIVVMVGSVKFYGSDLSIF
uniref:NADH dehydrogenase subunit 4L n=2 Tax=Angiostrongylus TaxID=6312 RepID=A0A0M4JC49_ANGCA|nr:NADH dehydrogenase subunit 4L [Angiostrongylus malaysiensis]ALD62327.1 NADH dehydrogenase subunit 4L [Angiostrongylus cantonensis]ANG44577.1 NADH dehydrogenase subunit 4L [Angiostrongylus malaysiensis]